MSPKVQKMIAQAVVRYLDGSYALFQSRAEKASEAYSTETERNRLHATVEEIIEYKKRSVICE